MNWHGSNNEVICKGQFKAICPVCGNESKTFDEIHDFVDWVVDNWCTHYVNDTKGSILICSKCGGNKNV